MKALWSKMNRAAKGGCESRQYRPVELAARIYAPRTRPAQSVGTRELFRPPSPPPPPEEHVEPPTPLQPPRAPCHVSKPKQLSMLPSALQLPAKPAPRIAPYRPPASAAAPSAAGIPFPRPPLSLPPPRSLPARLLPGPLVLTYKGFHLLLPSCSSS